MKNNQVYINPGDLENSLRQLRRFYRLDDTTLDLIRRVIEQYPKPVILYVDEANAPMMVHSSLDDLFTFNMETGELVLFSADPHTFINAMVEMWMYVAGFDTRMGADSYWEVEFAIGAWKVVRDNIKRRLGIPVDDSLVAIVGLPPEPDEASLDDPYPFETLVSSLNTVSFAQIIRLAGRGDIRVHFPVKTHTRVMELFFNAKRLIRNVGKDLDIEDAADFNRKLDMKIRYLRRRYDPESLPVPPGWQFKGQDTEAASGEMPGGERTEQGQVGLLLGAPQDEPADPENAAVDRRLAEGPFGAFIDTLFED